MRLLPISSVWLGLGLGCVAGHNYNQQRSSYQGESSYGTAVEAFANYVVHYVGTGGLFNMWGGSSCRGWGSRRSFIGRRAWSLSQSVRSCGILRRFGLLEVLDLLMASSILHL
jgi:hypothetical protein